MRKIYQKAPNADHLRVTAEFCDMSIQQLGVALGVTGSGTVSRWIGDDVAPSWTVLACEALRARHGEKKATARALFLLSLPSSAPDQTAALIKHLAEGLGGSFVTIPNLVEGISK